MVLDQQTHGCRAAGAVGGRRAGRRTKSLARRMSGRGAARTNVFSTCLAQSQRRPFGRTMMSPAQIVALRAVYRLSASAPGRSFALQLRVRGTQHRFKFSLDLWILRNYRPDLRSSSYQSYSVLLQGVAALLIERL